MSKSEDPVEVPTPETAGDEEVTQLSEIKSQLAEAEGRIVETIKKRLTAADDELTKTRDDLRSLKAQKLDSRWLAAVAAILGVAIGIGFLILSIHILEKTLTWTQICGILGLCFLWVAFAAISIRLLADRAK